MADDGTARERPPVRLLTPAGRAPGRRHLAGLRRVRHPFCIPQLSWGNMLSLFE